MSEENFLQYSKMKKISERGENLLIDRSICLSVDEARDYLIELEQFLLDPSHLEGKFFRKSKFIDENFQSMFVEVSDRLDFIRNLCFKRSEQIRQTIGKNFFDDQKPKINRKQKHVFMELLETEKIYVEELKMIVENYFSKLNDDEENRFLPSTIVQNRSILFSNLPEICSFHENFFLPELEKLIEENFSIRSLSFLFVQQKFNFRLYENYVLNKSQSEQVWKEFCSNHEFFTKIQNSLGHRLSLDAYLLKPIQRLGQYKLLLKEIFKFTDRQDERDDLEKAIDVIQTVLSDINDRMHSTHIVGFSEHLSTIGQLRLRAENCSICRIKTRSTVYQRNKTSQRDLFLFERKILICKRKDETSKNLLQYQFKTSIQIDQIVVCGKTTKNLNQIEILLKDSTFFIQFFDDEERKNTAQRWIETIRILIDEQNEKRRSIVKQRSASLDHSQNSRRRKRISKIDEIKSKSGETPWL